MHPRPDLIITNRRKDEEVRNSLLQTTAYYAKFGLQSHFEESTSAAIRKKKILHRFEELKLKSEKELVERKEKLKELLSTDQEKYRQELFESEHSKESRLEEMRARVKELREKREKERKEIVDAKMTQKWRNECDELRTLQSQLRVKKVTEERAKQLKEHEQIRQSEIEEKKYYNDLWEQDRLKKIQREDADKAHREALNSESIRILEEQVKQVRAQAAYEEQLKHEEGQLTIKENEMRRMEEERARVIKEQEQDAVRADLDAFNKARISQKAQQVQQVLEMDLKILADLLEQEKKEREFKLKRREEFKKEMILYHQHLEQQQHIEIEREKELTRLHKDEEEKLLKARALRWEKEQNARDRLMQDVIRGRQIQLEEALERNRQAQQEAHKIKIHMQQEVEKTKELTAKAAALKHQKAEQYHGFLVSQIASNESKRQEQQKLAEAEDAKIRALENLYKRLVEKELETALEESRNQKGSK